MGYPYGPQQGHDPYGGQGYAQPGYGDPYGGQPGYAAQPYAQPGYGAPVYGAAPYPYAPGYGQPRPGGGTAITAAVITLLLSLISGLFLAIGVAATLGSSKSSSIDAPVVMVPLIVGGGVCLLWFLGSILLFRRKAAGRVILIMLSSLAVLGMGVSTVVSLGNTGDPAPTIIGGVLGGGLALLILCLAAAPSTGRWIRAGRPSGHQHYPQY
ncbi:hypothetical protein [Nocardia sp. NPDC058633]|uniref:hypothetical protein n=1 Tax=Nocardia sp. NPDC058633 TaxID=3346568 RepID=UPI003653D691